jgi:3-hydroxyisobutyrate dehydrogenase-like beta-hydroxyacid dehydrogenase
MKVGFIGAGNVTGTFGRHLINAGAHHRCIQFQRTADTG